MDIIYFEGCQRSGNHLVIEWLRAHMQKSLFLENMFYSLEEQFDGNLQGKNSPEFGQQLAYIQSAVEDGLSHTIVSHEHPGNLSSRNVQSVLNCVHDVAVLKKYKIHLLRDPLNWMASYAKLRAGYKLFGMSRQHDASKSDVYQNYSKFHAEYWQRWYRSFQLWTNSPDTVLINYNQFIVDVAYRQRLAGELGLNWQEQQDSSALAKQARHGSSFETHGKTPEAASHLNRFDYLLPLFMALPIPSHVLDALKEHFPEVFSKYNELAAKNDVDWSKQK